MSYYNDTGAYQYDYDRFMPREKAVRMPARRGGTSARSATAARRPAPVRTAPPRTSYRNTPAGPAPRERRNTRVGARDSAAPRKSRKLGRKMLITALIVGLLVFSLFTRMKISDTTDQINSADNTLSMLQAEQVKLNMEIESKVNLKTLEQTALEMGMQKIQKYQIKYVDLTVSDKTVADTPQNTGILSTLSDMVNALVK